MIVNDNASRFGYQMLLRTLAKGLYRYGCDCGTMLGEIIGMYLGSGAQSGNSIPLRSFMQMAQISRSQASCAGARTWSEDVELPEESATSMAMKASRLTYTWAVPGLPDSVVTGEGLARRADYLRALIAARRPVARQEDAFDNHSQWSAGGGTDQSRRPPRRRLQTGFQSQVGSNVSHARTIRPSDSASNVGSNVRTIRPSDIASNVGTTLSLVPPAANPITGSRQHANNPPMCTGYIDVGDRCMRCGKAGHNQDECPGPNHLLFRNRPRSWLLNEMSWGRIPLV